MNLKLGVEGLYRIKVLRKDGSVRYENKVPFNNLITDLGMASFFIDPQTAEQTFCLVGSGSTPPTTGDTQLESQLGLQTDDEYSTLSHSEYDRPGETPRYNAVTIVYEWAVGDVVGNISEIGIKNTNSGANIISRALIQDDLGNPTTLTILADESLVALYEFRVYLPTGDSDEGTYDVDGTPTQLTMRPLQVDGAYISYWNLFNPLSVLTGVLAGGVGIIWTQLTALEPEEGATLPHPSFMEDGEGSTLGHSGSATYRDTDVFFGAGSEADDEEFAVVFIVGQNINKYGLLGGWQILFNPPFTKSATDKVNIRFRVSLARV